MNICLIPSAKLACSIGFGTLALSLILAAPASFAQEAEPDATASLQAANREEITVTARRREESLQDVPISITAFDSDTLRDKNILNAYDVAANTPNFSFTPNLGRRLDVPNIRGQFGPLIGSTAPNAGFFVDGVYVAGSIGSTSTANLERVEILRGPQSSLFGRATFSGAVNYITRRPSEEFEGQVNTLVGQDQRRQLGVWGSGPIIENKLYFFAGLDYTAWDGEWTNNLQPGQVDSTSLAGPFGAFIWRNNPQLPGDPPCPPGSLPPPGGGAPGCAPTVGDNSKLGGEQTKTGTFKLLFTPTDDLDIVFKYENSQADDDHFAYNFVPPGENNNCFNRDTLGNALDPRAGSRSGGWICGALDDNGFRPVFNLPNFRRGVRGTPPGAPIDPDTNQPQALLAPPAPFIGLKEDIDRFLTEFTYDFNDYEVMARYAGENRESEFVRDLDRSYALGPAATGLFEGYERQLDELDSFELRLASPADGAVSWSLGYYYYEQDSAGFARDFTGFNRINVISTGTNQVENKAVFGTVEWQISDQFTAAFDGRYAADTISRQSDNSAAEETFYNFSPRLILRWTPTDNLSTYISAAEGNKPGGFNFQYFENDVDPNELIENADKTVVEEEEAWTYEIGAKGEFMDGRLAMSGALFYIDWTNQAINVQECIDLINLQTGEPNGECELNNIVANAGESRVLGLELEGTFYATDSLYFTFGYGWTDSQLEEFVDEEFAIIQCLEGCYETLPGTDEFTPDAIALRNQLGDVSGNQAPLVPEHNLNVSSFYQKSLNAELDWFFRNDWRWESKRYATPANLVYAPANLVWNSRIGLEAEGWTLFAYVNNLTDETSPIQIQDFPLFDATAGYLAPGGSVNPNAFSILPRQSRNFGLQGQYRF